MIAAISGLRKRGFLRDLVDLFVDAWNQPPIPYDELTCEDCWPIRMI